MLNCFAQLLLLFAKAHMRFLTVPHDAEGQPRVFTLIYKVSDNLGGAPPRDLGNKGTGAFIFRE